MMNQAIKNKKKIAILIATYQGEEYLNQQLDSLLRQSNQDWTAYLHDDGSKDGTQQIIKLYCTKYPDKFIEITGDSCGSAKHNFIFLTKKVESDFYMYCDQDDIWMENKICDTYKKMIEIDDPDIPCLVHTDLSVVAKDLSVISRSMAQYQGLKCNKQELSRTLIQNVVTGCTMMINRCLRDKMIMSCNWDCIIMHDWWASLIAVAFGKIAYLNQPTILYRQHGDNSVGAKRIFSLNNFINTINHSDKIKKSLEDTRIQANEFNKVFHIKSNSPSVIYSNMGKYTKLKRIQIYMANHFYKSSFARNIGLFIWG